MAKRATAAQRRARAKFAAKYAHKKRKAKSKHTKHTKHTKRSASKRKTTKRKRAAKRGGHKLLVHKGKLYTYYGQVER